MARMTGSEALVEALRIEEVSVVFGLVGSAFMDALDIFPKAGIRFLPVRHEQNAAHMADGYARVTGRPGVCIGQNGPGITNMVTGIAAAYLAHSPVVLLSPAVTSASAWTDGFQEADQLKIFEAITKWQVRVNRADRIPEFVRNAFRIALAELGPTQVDFPRDLLYEEVDVDLIPPRRYRTARRGAGDPDALEEAAALLFEARFPVILVGQGAVYSGAQEVVAALAEYLTAPVATTYLHNDAFPASHPLMVGAVGYGGSKAAMRLVREADVILALGSRLGIFGTLPQYGMKWWPENARLIQVDQNARELGRVRPFEVGIIGDAKLAAAEILRALKRREATRKPDAARLERINMEKQRWKEELEEMSSSGRRPISPRRALREIQKVLPRDVIVATDVGNICAMANAYLEFERPRRFLGPQMFGNCGFAYPAALGAKVAAPDAPVVALVGDGAWGMSMSEVLTAVQWGINVVAVVFNNSQWGAEKKNQVDYYGSRFLGTLLMDTNYAEIARAMGAVGYRVESPGEVGDVLRAALQEDRPAVLDVVVAADELFEPFRRDALRVPVRYLERYK